MREGSKELNSSLAEDKEEEVEVEVDPWILDGGVVIAASDDLPLLLMVVVELVGGGDADQPMLILLNAFAHPPLPLVLAVLLGMAL